MAWSLQVVKLWNLTGVNHFVLLPNTATLNSSPFSDFPFICLCSSKQKLGLWLTSVMPSLQMLKQKKRNKFKANLGYIASSRPTQATV